MNFDSRIFWPFGSYSPFLSSLLVWLLSRSFRQNKVFNIIRVGLECFGQNIHFWLSVISQFFVKNFKVAEISIFLISVELESLLRPEWYIAPGVGFDGHFGSPGRELPTCYSSQIIQIKHVIRGLKLLSPSIEISDSNKTF